jgi:hypothetical protein
MFAARLRLGYNHFWGVGLRTREFPRGSPGVPFADASALREVLHHIVSSG